MNKLKNSLIVLAVVATLLNLALLAGTLMTPMVPTVVAETEKEKAPRNFYLTTTEHNGSQALTACAEGYHMASVWEILDPSNLRYDTALGFMQQDSGFGPPTGRSGWIRTGYFATDFGTPGNANCRAWTNASNANTGTLVVLGGMWDSTNAKAISPWETSELACHLTNHVWCVQD